jgi:hypothetical protein
MKRKSMNVEQLKETWRVVAIVAGMGDVHDPEVKPFVIVRGTRWEKLRGFNEEWNCKKAHGDDGIKEVDGEKYGLRNTKFSAFVCNGKARKFYNNKATKRFEAEIDEIIANWGEFQLREYRSDHPTNAIEEISKCNICEMKKVPGYRMQGYGQSHSICTLCMVEATASWLIELREKL